MCFVEQALDSCHQNLLENVDLRDGVILLQLGKKGAVSKSDIPKIAPEDGPPKVSVLLAALRREGPSAIIMFSKVLQLSDAPQNRAEGARLASHFEGETVTEHGQSRRRTRLSWSHQNGPAVSKAAAGPAPGTAALPMEVPDCSVRMRAKSRQPSAFMDVSSQQGQPELHTLARLFQQCTEQMQVRPPREERRCPCFFGGCGTQRSELEKTGAARLRAAVASATDVLIFEECFGSSASKNRAAISAMMESADLNIDDYEVEVLDQVAFLTAKSHSFRKGTPHTFIEVVLNCPGGNHNQKVQAAVNHLSKGILSCSVQVLSCLPVPEGVVVILRLPFSFLGAIFEKAVDHTMLLTSIGLKKIRCLGRRTRLVLDLQSSDRAGMSPEDKDIVARALVPHSDFLSKRLRDSIMNMPSLSAAMHRILRFDVGDEQRHRHATLSYERDRAASLKSCADRARRNKVQDVRTRAIATNCHSPQEVGTCGAAGSSPQATTQDAGSAHLSQSPGISSEHHQQHDRRPMTDGEHDPNVDLLTLNGRGNLAGGDCVQASHAQVADGAPLVANPPTTVREWAVDSSRGSRRAPTYSAITGELHIPKLNLHVLSQSPMMTRRASRILQAVQTSPTGGSDITPTQESGHGMRPDAAGCEQSVDEAEESGHFYLHRPREDHLPAGNPYVVRVGPVVDGHTQSRQQPPTLAQCTRDCLKSLCSSEVQYVQMMCTFTEEAISKLEKSFGLKFGMRGQFKDICQAWREIHLLHKFELLHCLQACPPDPGKLASVFLDRESMFALYVRYMMCLTHKESAFVEYRLELTELCGPFGDPHHLQNCWREPLRRLRVYINVLERIEEVSDGGHDLEKVRQAKAFLQMLSVRSDHMTELSKVKALEYNPEIDGELIRRATMIVKVHFANAAKKRREVFLLDNHLLILKNYPSEDAYGLKKPYRLEEVTASVLPGERKFQILIKEDKRSVVTFEVESLDQSAEQWVEEIGQLKQQLLDSPHSKERPLSARSSYYNQQACALPYRLSAGSLISHDESLRNGNVLGSLKSSSSMAVSHPASPPSSSSYPSSTRVSFPSAVPVL